jgi:hypothetical protein
MGNASKRVLGKSLNRGDLALSDKLLFAQRVRPRAKKSVEMLGGATLMAKSTVSELSRLCGKQDFKYGK